MGFSKQAGDCVRELSCSIWHTLGVCRYKVTAEEGTALTRKEKRWTSTHGDCFTVREEARLLHNNL